MSHALVVIDYLRESHVKKDSQGNWENCYLATNHGKKLIEKLSNANISPKEMQLDYVYPLIPEPKKVDSKTGRTITYKNPTQKEWKPYSVELGDRIVDTKPRIVIPTGSIGSKFTVDVASITTTRGRPVLKEFTHSVTGETYEVWVLPTFSMEYIITQPNVEGKLDADMVSLGKFWEIGDQVFLPSKSNYEYVTSMDRVREIFNQFKTPRIGLACPTWLVAWDLETNSLKPEVLGAKPLVMSLSWDHGQGVTIPLEHKDWTGWSQEELAEIYQLIADFVADGTFNKVGHNIQYDIRFLMSTKGMTVFRNHRDTKILYWMTVTQKLEESFKLSDLTFELTDMGGYDSPLEDFKKADRARRILEANAQVKQINAQRKEENDLTYKQALERFEEARDNAKKEGRPFRDKKPVKKDFVFDKVTVADVEPHTKNPIDGSDYSYEWIPLEIMHPYASGDTDACRRIHESLIANIERNQKMIDLFTDFYPKATVALARIESNGTAVDREYMELIDREYTKEEDRLLAEIRKLPEVQELEQEHVDLYTAGCVEFAKPKAERDPEIAKLRDKYKAKVEFNPNSAPDKGRVLYDILGIRLPYNKEMIKPDAFDSGKPENSLTWEDFKTDKHAMGYIIEHVPEGKALAELLLQHSKVKTLKNNFTSKLLRFISNKTGRVHGSYNLTGTETSRLSSSNPNMQQIPSKTGDVTRFDYVYPIKKMFISRFGKDGCLFQMDYSSLEMRILALIAKDEAMTRAFFDGADLHKETASIIFGVPLDEVTPDQRQSAKAVNFGIAYGETPFSIAPKQGWTVEQAEEVFDKYFANKPQIKEFIEETHKQALKDGYVDTAQGHRRLIREAFSDDKSKVNGALRQSVNTIIQGTGAYFTNLSLVYLDEYIQSKGLRSKVVMTVHDSIVIDAPKDEADEIAKVAKYIMENLPIPFTMIPWEGKEVRYPIVADVEIGPNYGSLIDYDKEELSEYASLEGCVKYHKDKGKLFDYMNAGRISEEHYESAVATIDGAIEAYKNYLP